MEERVGAGRKDRSMAEQEEEGSIVWAGIANWSFLRIHIKLFSGLQPANCNFTMHGDKSFAYD